MEKYINYIFEEIIKDFEHFIYLYDNYQYLTWIILWIFWFIFLLIKNSILTMPIWLLYNITIGNTILQTSKKYKKSIQK